MTEDRITPYQAEREVSGTPEYRIFAQVISDAKTLLDVIRPDELFSHSRTNRIGDILATARLNKIDTEHPKYVDVVEELRWYLQNKQSTEYVGGILQELEESHLVLEEIAHQSGQKIPVIKLL